MRCHFRQNLRKHSFNRVLNRTIRHGLGYGPSPIQVYGCKITIYATNPRSKTCLVRLLRHIGES